LPSGGKNISTKNNTSLPRKSPIITQTNKSSRNLFKALFTSDFVKKIAETFTTRVLLIVVGIITSILVARILGPEGKGEIAIATTFAAIGVQFLNLGLYSSNTYYVSKDISLLSTLIGNSLLASFLIGGVTGLITYILFTIKPSLAPIQGNLLLFALIWIPFGLAYLLAQSLLIAVNHIRDYNRIELVTKILNVILIGILLILAKVSVTSVFMMTLISLLFGFAWIHLKLLNFSKGIPRLSFSLFKSNFRYGLKAYLAAFFAFLVIRIDLLMIKYLLNDEQAGYYSIAVNLADLIYMLPVVIGLILFPKLSSMENIQSKWMYTKTTTFWTGILMFLFIIILGLTIKPIINLLFGKDFLPSATALLFLLPGIFFLSISTVAVQFLNSIGFPKMIVVFWAITTLLNLGLNLIAIPHYGIVGASVVSTFSYIFVFCLVSVLIRRYVLSYE